MDGQLDGVVSEQIPQAFLCSICLDLLYKPVVLACGHVSCFWCVHESMNGLPESHCPICRHPYLHFPTICQKLNSLLLKLYPVTCKIRENQILEEERKMGIFSPTFDDPLHASHANVELNHLDDQSQASITNNPDNLSPNHSSPRKVEPSGDMKLPESVILGQDNVLTGPKQITIEGCSCTVGAKENNLPRKSCNEICQRISIDDVLCAACKQLLFRPVVLNCGHVYCETCIIPADEPIKCQICQSLHPRGFPKVFLELDHFLEEQFSKEYIERKHVVELKQVQVQSCSAEAGKKSDPFSCPMDENFLQRLGGLGSKVHIGVGCDSCGMYPIIGDRYRCKDCKEAIGFDLCGDCYNTDSKLPGRFNQQHTADHRFQIEEPIRGRILLLGLQRGQLEHDSSVLLVPDNASENPDYVFSPSPSDNDTGNAENNFTVPSTSQENEEDQNDDHESTI